jgi:hypothetical protein
LGHAGGDVMAGAVDRGQSIRRDSADVAAVCWRFVQAGYNPVCLFDGDRVEVVPDFVVSHKLSEVTPSPSPFVVIPAVA